MLPTMPSDAIVFHVGPAEASNDAVGVVESVSTRHRTSLYPLRSLIPMLMKRLERLMALLLERTISRMICAMDERSRQHGSVSYGPYVVLGLIALRRCGPWRVRSGRCPTPQPIFRMRDSAIEEAVVGYARL